jgi:hypothetical protein
MKNSVHEDAIKNIYKVQTKESTAGEPFVLSFICAKKGSVGHCMSNKHTTTISLREFKEFVRDRYSHDSSFYQVMAVEKDEMPCEEYAAKFLTWLKLIQISVPTTTTH